MGSGRSKCHYPPRQTAQRVVQDRTKVQSARGAAIGVVLTCDAAGDGAARFLITIATRGRDDGFALDGSIQGL
jgi:hypothetical protein